MKAEEISFNYSPSGSLSSKLSKQYSGKVNYDKIVSLYKKLKYEMTDTLRLLSFRREAI